MARGIGKKLANLANLEDIILANFQDILVRLSTSRLSAS